jgi:hypothetical protein
MHQLARRLVAVCLLQIALWGWSVQAQGVPVPPEDLAARFEQLRRQGAVQLGQQPVFLQSTEAPERLEGEVLALIDHPVLQVRTALAQAAVWCDILILHLNVKYCRAARRSGPAGAVDTLEVGLGRKYDEPLSGVHWLGFRFRAGTSAVSPASPPGASPPAVELLAPEGPLDTRDIRITVQTSEAPGGAPCCSCAMPTRRGRLRAGPCRCTWAPWAGTRSASAWCRNALTIPAVLLSL